MKERLMGALSGVWAAAPASMRRQVLFATNDHFLIGVIGVIRDPQGRVLLLEHRFRTSPWGLPGGFIEHDESLEEALARELKEEVNLEIEDIRPAVDVELNQPSRYVSIALPAFVKHPPSQLDIRAKSEIITGGFFAPDALPKDVYPYHRGLIERLATKLHLA